MVASTQCLVLGVGELVSFVLGGGELDIFDLGGGGELGSFVFVGGEFRRRL